MDYNHRSPAVKRLIKEAQELKASTELYYAQPVEDNLFEWHFTIRGPVDSDYEGGVYHGRITFPPDYPMKPPSVIFLTPSGRFETNKKICLSISGYHPETWLPSWSTRTALLAIIGFMPSPSMSAIGSVNYPPSEKKKLAKKSLLFKCNTCGTDIPSSLKPITGATNPEAEEAKNLGAKIKLGVDIPGKSGKTTEEPSEKSNEPDKSSTGTRKRKAAPKKAGKNEVKSAVGIASVIQRLLDAHSADALNSDEDSEDDFTEIYWKHYWRLYRIQTQGLRQNLSSGGANTIQNLENIVQKEKMELGKDKSSLKNEKNFLQKETEPSVESEVEAVPDEENPLIAKSSLPKESEAKAAGGGDKIEGLTHLEPNFKAIAAARSIVNPDTAEGRIRQRLIDMNRRLVWDEVESKKGSGDGVKTSGVPVSSAPDAGDTAVRALQTSSSSQLQTRARGMVEPRGFWARVLTALRQDVVGFLIILSMLFTIASLLMRRSRRVRGSNLADWLGDVDEF